MRMFLRWWETLGRPERIVAMSLAAGGAVAVANSTTWAIAVCYMARQKALVAMHTQRERTGTEATLDPAGAYGPPPVADPAPAPAAGRRS